MVGGRMPPRWRESARHDADGGGAGQAGAWAWSSATSGSGVFPGDAFLAFSPRSPPGRRGIYTHRRVLAATASVVCRIAPPMSFGGDPSKNQPRRGEAATFRCRMSGWHDQTAGLGVTIARHRPIRWQWLGMIGRRRCLFARRTNNLYRKNRVKTLDYRGYAAKQGYAGMGSRSTIQVAWMREERDATTCISPRLARIEKPG
jgi:hypothetical protein